MTSITESGTDYLYMAELRCSRISQISQKAEFDLSEFTAVHRRKADFWITLVGMASQALSAAAYSTGFATVTLKLKRQLEHRPARPLAPPAARQWLPLG
jgi:hypothetical protein